jgi:hypothetical protein
MSYLRNSIARCLAWVMRGVDKIKLLMGLMLIVIFAVVYVQGPQKPDSPWNKDTPLKVAFFTPTELLSTCSDTVCPPRDYSKLESLLKKQLEHKYKGPIEIKIENKSTSSFQDGNFSEWDIIWADDPHLSNNLQHKGFTLAGTIPNTKRTSWFIVNKNNQRLKNFDDINRNTKIALGSVDDNLLFSLPLSVLNSSLSKPKEGVQIYINNKSEQIINKLRQGIVDLGVISNTGHADRSKPTLEQNEFSAIATAGTVPESGIYITSHQEEIKIILQRALSRMDRSFYSPSTTANIDYRDSQDIFNKVEHIIHKQKQPWQKGSAPDRLLHFVPFFKPKVCNESNFLKLKVYEYKLRQKDLVEYTVQDSSREHSEANRGTKRVTIPLKIVEQLVPNPEDMKNKVIYVSLSVEANSPSVENLKVTDLGQVGLSNDCSVL